VKYLLDTNVISELTKAKPDERVQSRFDAHRGASVISALTWHELSYGVAKLAASRRKAMLQEFLDTVVGVRPPLAYEVRAAQWHAHERARLESPGRLLPFVDGQIASIAAVNGLTLVTRNVADFKGLKGLKVERWHSA
jgi:tRNA(fMet)-specific endonuclease VapC